VLTLDAVLSAVSRIIAEGDSDLERTLEQALRLTAAALSVQRLGVWATEPGADHLRCLCLFDTDTGRSTAGMCLPYDRYPRYFQALKEHAYISAVDAQADPRTAELRDSYLVPLGIVSMLDAPLLSPDGYHGVLCIEHTGSKRQWTVGEERFSGAIADLVSLAIHAHKRQEAEEDLRRSESNLRRALDVARLGVWEARKDSGITWHRDIHATFHGLPSDPQEFVRDWVHPDDKRELSRLAAAISGQNDGNFSMRYRLRRGNTWRWVQVDGEIRADEHGDLYVLGTLQDIHAQLELEARIQQQQTLDAMGRLAGEIAHDFNNVLSVIGTCASLLEITSEESGETVSIILDTVSRGATLAKKLLSFSRANVHSPQNIEADALIRDMVPFITRLLPADIVLTSSLTPALVYIDPGELEQVLMNLCINARDAMSGSGRLHISLTTDGDEAVIGVQDEGGGIPPEIKARVFEPYFTTKEGKGGTGLGLSTCHGIVARAGGRLEILDTSSAGTTFAVFLPLVFR